MLANSPFAADGSSSLWGEANGRKIYRCTKTGATFFSREDLEKESYEDFYDFIESWGNSRFSEELRWRKPKHLRQLAQLRKLHPRAETLLDIGAGPGYLVANAKSVGWHAAGVEISAKARNAGEKFLDVKYVDLESLPPKSVDVITCQHVLEHVEKPSEFIAHLRSILSDDGVLAIQVPNEQPLSFRIKQLMRGPDLCTTLYGNIHINGFNGSSLPAFLARHDLRSLAVRNVGTWSYEYDPFFFIPLMRHRQYVPVIKKCLRGMVDWLGVPFDRGDWVVGYFRKK